MHLYYYECSLCTMKFSTLSYHNYIISYAILSDEMFKTFAVFQAYYCISSCMWEFRCTVATDVLISSLMRLTNSLAMPYPIIEVALIN